MPYEMLNYVVTETQFGGIVRYGGNIELLKRLVAAGFPVVIERGYMDSKQGWMGHYGLVYGYDDATKKINIPDTYLGEITMSYENIEMYWAHFDDIYLVIYPWEREQEVKDIMGMNWDENYKKPALEQLSNRITMWRAGSYSLLVQPRIDLVELQDSQGQLCMLGI